MNAACERIPNALWNAEANLNVQIAHAREAKGVNESFTVTEQVCEPSQTPEESKSIPAAKPAAVALDPPDRLDAFAGQSFEELPRPWVSLICVYPRPRLGPKFFARARCIIFTQHRLIHAKLDG
jgi:hypothetical protein